jgi:iron(III) transport system ATP-binding protein
MLAITLENLSKSFPAPVQRSSFRVPRSTPSSPLHPSSFTLQHLTLSIPPGTLFFLLGPSGCGKTTLLRIIAGFLTPTSGRVLFDGRDMTDVPAYDRDTGMVFQSYALWPHMTVGENVAFGLNVRKIKNPELTRRIDESLELVQMSPYKDRRPNQLSGGQQQRVALARALAIRPQCLLLDEPLSNLDAKLRLEMRSEIRRIVKAAGGGRGGGITAIYVTHDQKEALSMADQIAVMNRGRLEQVGTPEELYQRPATRFVADFIGESNFIEGTIAQITSTSLLIHTPAGPLRAALPRNTANRNFSLGTPVTLAIRPEAIALTPKNPSQSDSNSTPSLPNSSESLLNNTQLAPNFLPGTRLSSTYLGETAEHLIQLPGLPTPLKALEMNPRGTLPAPDVTLQIAPAQVLLVAPDTPSPASPA